MIRLAIKLIVLALIIIVYSHSVVFVTDDEWDVCVATGRCDFNRTDQFGTRKDRTDG